MNNGDDGYDGSSYQVDDRLAGEVGSDTVDLHLIVFEGLVARSENKKIITDNTTHRMTIKRKRMRRGGGGGEEA